jgi:NNP family nitrate/nitrite transporter-like MFS transporter
VFAGMVAATGVATLGVQRRAFVVFLGAFLVVFLLSGVGNGSTYRMIPVIFGALGREASSSRGSDPSATLLDYKRRAAAVIGLVGALGAFGGFGVQQVFRVASQDASAALDGKTGQVAAAVAADHAGWALPALGVFIGFYVVCGVLTWWVYLRRTLLVARVSSLAYANV